MASGNEKPEKVRCGSCGRRNRVPRDAGGQPTCGVCHAPLRWLVDADDRSFDAAVGGSLPVLVDLWAPWCGPCRMVAPAVERAADELAGRLKVVKVDVDRAPGVSARFGVRGVPTLLVLRGGAEVARQVGAQPADALVGWVRRSVGDAAGARH